MPRKIKDLPDALSPKAEKLNKLVDAIPGVCDGGRDGIRALVAEITGERLILPPQAKHKIGDHFRLGSKTFLLSVAGTPDDKRVVAVNIATGARKSPVIGTPIKSYVAITDDELCGILRCSAFALKSLVKKVHDSELACDSPLNRPRPYAPLRHY